jgi:SGNH hydrolase-like domain, acetyltransferase AlgX
LFQPKVLQLGVNITGNISDYTERGYFNKNIFYKPEGEFRILSLGDSFARNLTWENQNYHDLLKLHFVNIGDKSIEIVNAGMENTGPGYYWHILKKYGDSFKPNLVMVGFFIGNDFGEMKFDFASLGPYGIRDYIDPGEKLKRFLRFPNWWLYQFIQRNIVLFKETRSRQDEVRENRVKEEATFSNRIFFQVQRARMWIFEKKERAHLERNFYNNSKVLLNIIKWCKTRNVELVVVLFPDQLQVEDHLLEKILEVYDLHQDSVDTSFPNRLLTQFLREHQVYCLDMLSEFQKQGRASILYRPNDTHWNAAGNQLAAKMISHFLRENRLVPENLTGQGQGGGKPPA